MNFLPQGLPGLPQGLQGLPQAVPGSPEAPPGCPTAHPGSHSAAPGSPKPPGRKIKDRFEQNPSLEHSAGFSGFAGFTGSSRSIGLNVFGGATHFAKYIAPK